MPIPECPPPEAKAQPAERDPRGHISGFSLPRQCSNLHGEQKPFAHCKLLICLGSGTGTWAARRRSHGEPAA